MKKIWSQVKVADQVTITGAATILRLFEVPCIVQQLSFYDLEISSPCPDDYTGVRLDHGLWVPDDHFDAAFQLVGA